MNTNTEKRIKILLDSKEKLTKRLSLLQKEFEKEKDNEDAWPGHSTNFLLQIQQDEQLITSLLADIEKNLKELGYNSYIQIT